MARVTVRIDSLSAVVRRTSSTTPEALPELSLTVNARDQVAAINKAIRVLTGERDALMEGKSVSLPPFNGDEDDEEEEDED